MANDKLACASCHVEVFYREQLMSSNGDDFLMVRLIKAFRRVIDPDARRTLLLYIEEEARQNEKGAEKRPPLLS